jgi:hypothetical protein
MPKRIISFSGRKGSGKTLMAKLTVKYGYTLLNFADEIKNVVCKVLGIDISFLNNIKDIDLEKRNSFDFKFKFTKESILLIASLIDIPNEFVEKVFPLNSKLKSIRELLQKLGTDLIRKHNPEWHVNKMRLKIQDNKRYVIADTRFINEMNLIKEFNGENWFIIRPEYKDISNHISETSLNWSQFDSNFIIINNRDYSYLEEHWNNYMKNDILSFDKYSRYERFPKMMYGSQRTQSCPELNSEQNPFIMEDLKMFF